MNENLSLYRRCSQPPQEALKTIGAGRLKGYTDINPMWRIMKLTEEFGPCGVGWKYTIDRQWTEPGANNELSAFCNISLFVKIDGGWSEAIPGTGGASFVAKERSGMYTSDECYKMALTDALSVACKALGFGDTVEKAWAQRDVRQTCDTVLIPEVVGLEETGEKAGEQTDVAQTYDTVLIPEGARAETVKKAGEQRDVAQAGDSAVTHETRRGVARRKARKNVRSNVRKETAQDASVTEAQKEPREGEDCGEQDIVRLEPEDFATVLGKEKELLEVAVPVLERLFRQMPDCLFTLANARGVVLETWGNGSIAGLEKGSLVNEYTPAIAGMTTALVTGRPGIARRQGGSGNETLVCVSAPINDEGGTTLACVTVTSRDNHPYLNVIAGEAADNIASQLRLRASLARESALVENAEEGLMAVDASGRIRRANRVARTMCSVSTLPEKAHLSRFFCLGSLLEDIARGEAFSRVRVELYDREQECGSGEYCLMSFVPGEDGGVLLLRCAEEVVSEGKDVASAQTGKSARGRALGESLRMLECELISEALREAEGNVTLAARNLGIARSTLYSRLERHNLHPREFRSLGASSRAKQRTRKNAAASAEREVSEAGTAPRE